MICLTCNFACSFKCLQQGSYEGKAGKTPGNALKVANLQVDDWNTTHDLHHQIELSFFILKSIFEQLETCFCPCPTNKTNVDL